MSAKLLPKTKSNTIAEDYFQPLVNRISIKTLEK